MAQFNFLKMAAVRRALPLFLALLALVVPWGALAAETASPAPDCALTPPGSEPAYGLQRLRGKVVYVDFWASWCGPCAQSFPFLNTLDRDYRDQGLHVVGVNLDENPAEAQEFLARHPARFSVATGSNVACAEAFGVKAMPSSYLVDRKGVVRHEHLGFRPGETGEIRELVQRLLAEDTPTQ